MPGTASERAALECISPGNREEVVVSRFNWIVGGVAMALVLALTSAACGPKDPNAKVAQLRSYYKAEVNGFLVQGPPAEDPWDVTEPPMEGELDEELAEEVAGEELEGEMADMEMEPVEPAVTNIQLDVLVRHRSPENLPGITVDVSMVDAGQNEKGHWLWWVDTADIAKSNVTQFTYVIEDVSYEEGDGFYVEVRHPVPAEERAQYREFSSTP